MAVMMLLFFSEFFDLVNLLFGTDLRKGFASITVSHIAFNISFVSVVVRARLAGMDKRLEEAAMDLYASRWKAFRHVTLPQIAPGVAGGALLALTLSLDDVVVTQFASGPGATTLPVYVFGLIRRGVTPLINSVSVVMLIASIGLVLLSLFVQRSRGGAAAGPPGSRRRRGPLAPKFLTKGHNKPNTTRRHHHVHHIPPPAAGRDPHRRARRRGLRG